MSRYARGKEPYAPKMEHVEVPENHVRLRAILFVLAILLAVVAFGFGLNSLLTPETGWKAVEASGLNSGEITLQYNYGAGAQGTAAERRLVSDVYSTALTQAEQQLSQAGNNTVSLYTVSTNPNQTVTVEPILCRAGLPCHRIAYNVGRSRRIYARMELDRRESYGLDHRYSKRHRLYGSTHH